MIAIRGQLKRLWPGVPWVFDNGAFVDWKHGREFNDAEWRADIEKIRNMDERPEWSVLPDIVAGGDESLEFSSRYLREYSMKDPSLRWVLAVQDGMEPDQVSTFLLHPAVVGLFVGGTVEWKHATARQWAQLAHRYGKICHVGRMGTGRKVRLAADAGADSVDSAVPLFSDENMGRFLQAVFSAQRQETMEFGGDHDQD